jgi:biopolymer transport protein TolR
MITAPLLTAGVAVDLPNSQSKSLSQQDNAPFEISINKKGHVYVGKTKISTARLAAVLKTVAKETPDKRIYIRADQTLSYGRVMSVMGVVNQAGLTHVALISDPYSGKK